MRGEREPPGGRAREDLRQRVQEPEESTGAAPRTAAASPLVLRNWLSTKRIAFASVVILTMLAAEAFDPRLMWDAAARRERRMLA